MLDDPGKVSGSDLCEAIVELMSKTSYPLDGSNDGNLDFYVRTYSTVLCLPLRKRRRLSAVHVDLWAGAIFLRVRGLCVQDCTIVLPWSVSGPNHFM